MGNRILEFFKKQFSRVGRLFLADSRENLYKDLGKKVDYILEYEMDDIGLAAEFRNLYESALMVNGLNFNDNEIQKYNVDEMYPLKTKVTKEQALEIAGEFFASVFPEQKEHFLEILSGEGKNSEVQRIFLKLDETGKTSPYATAPDYPSDDITVNVPLYGDLRDVYSLVHEISHTIDARNGANETRCILGEVIPQAIERALDNFLYTMPKSQRDKYGFDLKTLKEDIKDRRLSTFVNRYNIIKNLQKLRNARKMQSTRYMLAQIYQTKFLKLFKSLEQFGQGINRFAKAIEANSIESANSVIGIDLSVENTNSRKNCLIETTKQFLDDINGKKTLENNDEIVSKLQEKYRQILNCVPKETVDKAFEVLEARRKQVQQGIKPREEKLELEVHGIFVLMKDFKTDIRTALIDNGVTLTHISSVPPEKMEGRRLRKSQNKPNYYKTDLVDSVFASSEPADGSNPYIARNDGGMIDIGAKIMFYGSDNIDVTTDEQGKAHAVLKQPNYAYFINSETFEPVVGLRKDRKGKPFFEFSGEWISSVEMSLENPNQVYGYKTITDVTDLLKNYQVLTDVNKQGIGKKLLGLKKEDKAKYTVEQIRLGNLRYINGEAKINEIDMSQSVDELTKS